MKPSTLKARLGFGTLLALLLLLLLTGFALDKAVRSSLLAAEQVRLERYFYLLFSLAEMSGEQLQLPESLLEPDLEQPTSGLAAYVFRTDGSQVWRSASSMLTEEPPQYQDFGHHHHPGQMQIQQHRGPTKRAFYADYDILWETDTGTVIPYRFALVHSGESFYSALGAFRTTMGKWLLLAVTAMAIFYASLLAWALRPLRTLANSLSKMQSGETNLLIGSYPKEIQRVVDRLNQVLESEVRLRKRYRNSLGDLAHSLKTPLAVLQNATPPPEAKDYARQIQEQVERMDQVVKYQLQRAVSEQSSGSKKQIPLLKTCERLGQSLRKIYRDKGISLALDISPTLLFVGDEQDLLEIMGNLLDNDFKYGHSHVTVSAHINANYIHINVDDDGDGIAESLNANPVERGQRLDTSKPGQGIGLAICADIAAGYQGGLKISRSPLGGARFTVRLPGAEA
ncbi:ATP-binding protein [Gilvimarinus chinensis]|uniref:ATP-binding protein n=1 Tax=Gilvimarinus chinensis TaxID=396005 RepID=UPI00036915EE|nr:ATP-binding protein [Gilvimarinus chinensis]